MSDPTTAPPPHPTMKRFSWAGLIVAIVGIVLASFWGYLNFSKPSGSTSIVNGPVNGVGINNGTVNNIFSQSPTPATPSPILSPQPLAPPPVTSSNPTPPISLTPKQKEARLAAWRRLNRQMEDFSVILTRGDELLKTLLDDTQADPAGEAGKVRQFANDVYNMRLALEATHNTMIGDQAEIGVLVKEAVRPPGAERGPSASIFHQLSQSAETLATDIASSRNYDRQNLEDRLTATAQALREWVDVLKKRQQEWSSLAQAQINTLSE
jgi:hypothetical protein